jgi:hypothetical protein
MTLAIGTPQYGSKKKNNFRLAEGSNVYRILPPLGELAAEGVWAVYESMHWGYRGTKGMRPFKCIQRKDFKTKMIKVQCPECDRIAEYVAKMEDRRKLLESQGMSKEQIDENLKPISDWLFSHNLDKKWYLNVLTPDGKIGRLAIPHKMYAQLQEVITDLVTKQNIDPIGVNGGVQFDLIRTGKGNQTQHRVAVVEIMETVNGRQMRAYKSAPLTDDVLARLSGEAYDLKNAVRTLTYDEIKRLVLSDGDPEIVDAVFSAGEMTAATAEDPDNGATASFQQSTNALAVPPPSAFQSTAAPAATLKTEAPAQQSVAASPSATVAEAPSRAPVIDPMQLIMAQMAALQAQLEAAKKATAPLVPPTATEQGGKAADMTDEDFIKKYGFGK